MSTPDSTPSDYAGLSKQEVAERLKNPTPNATATPRTDAIKFTAQLWDPEVGEETVVVVFASDYATIERELTAAKAEIAYVREESATHEHFKGEAYKIADTWKARAERAEAQLRERTQWQCKCGGTDCAGMAENERLRAEVAEAKKQKRLAWERHAEKDRAYGEALAERNQLRARAAAMEQLLGEIAAVIHERTEGHTVVYSDRLRPLLPRIDAARARKGTP